MLDVIIYTKHVSCNGMILKITKIKGVRENHIVSIWSSEVMRGGKRKLWQNSKSVQDWQVSGLVQPCVSPKEQVLRIGCVANLGWNGGESTTQSGPRNIFEAVSRMNDRKTEPSQACSQRRPSDRVEWSQNWELTPTAGTGNHNNSRHLFQII